MLLSYRPSQLIGTANQLSSFNMRATLAINGLKPVISRIKTRFAVTEKGTVGATFFKHQEAHFQEN